MEDVDHVRHEHYQPFTGHVHDRDAPTELSNEDWRKRNLCNTSASFPYLNEQSKCWAIGPTKALFRKCQCH